MKNLKHAFSLFGYITIEFTWEKKFQTFYNNIDNLWLYCKLLLENIRMFHYWTQQFTSFIADLCQDKTWREFVLFEDHRGVSNGTFPWRNCSNLHFWVHLLSKALTKHFLQGNISFLMINTKPLFMSWWKSAIKEVNYWAHYIGIHIIQIFVNPSHA